MYFLLPFVCKRNVTRLFKTQPQWLKAKCLFLFEVCLKVLMALMVFTAKNEAGKKMNIFYRGKTHVAVKITEKKTVFW